MKKEFSNKWQASKQPRKQRKYLFNAPLHTRHKFLSANLSKDLREKHSKRSIPIRKGDEVLVMRGSFKKKKVKVLEVDLKNSLVSLEGIQRAKKDGSKVNVWFHPSVLQIQTIAEDAKRTGQKAQETKAEKKEEKKEKTKEVKSQKQGAKNASN